MFRALGLLIVAVTCAEALEIRGAAFYKNVVYTWGTELAAWSLPDLTRKTLARGNFGEGGCIADLDGNGMPDFIGYEGAGLGRLTYRRAPEWMPETIDSEIEMHDCREATLFGRRGILMVNRGMQVRFYQKPESQSTHWPYREIYSFYTASYQGDLVPRDIDGDGFTDILCGNYWIKSPESFELPWRLFAINTHHETPVSAMVRFTPLPNGRLWIFQSHMEKARAMLFTRPADPKQIWEEELYGGDMNLSRLHGVAHFGGEVIAGENNGPQSRVLAFRPGAKPRVLFDGVDVLELFVMDDSRLLIVGPKAVEFRSYRPRK